MKTCFPDSKIAKNVQVHRTKCTAIVKNVLAQVEVQCLYEVLKKRSSPFFLTRAQIFRVSSSCAVLYGTLTTRGPALSLLEANLLDATSCTSESLAAAVVQCLSDKNIPMFNMTRLREHADESFVTIKQAEPQCSFRGIWKTCATLPDILDTVPSVKPSWLSFRSTCLEKSLRSYGQAR